MKSVLFVHGITEIGGAERELFTILDQLPAFDFRPTVACPKQGPLVQELLKRDIPIREVNFPAWRKLSSFGQRRAGVQRLRATIRTDLPQLVHVNDIWWVPQTLQSMKGMDIPVIGHVRQEIESPKARRYQLHRLHCVLPVSDQIQTSLIKGGVSQSRLKTLYSGLDINRFPQQEKSERFCQQLGIPHGAFLSGTVANIFPRKGYEVMLKALPAILDQIPAFHYLIIGKGNGPYEQVLRALVDDLHVQDHVHFLGFQDPVIPILGQLDLYVHPACMEGFGIAVLEAMAMGKAVVATRTGGIPEIIENGETGVLVPPGDSHSLALAIVLLARDKTRRKEMGSRGRERARKRFSIQAMMENLITSYHEILEHSS